MVAIVRSLINTITRSNANPNPINDSQNICVITQEAIQDPLKTRCNHIFEKVALLQWVQRKNTCPVCREENPIPIASAQTNNMAAKITSWLRNQMPTAPVSIIDRSARIRIPTIEPQRRESFANQFSAMLDQAKRHVTEVFSCVQDGVTNLFQRPVSDRQRFSRVENFISLGDLRNAELETGKMTFAYLKNSAYEQIIETYIQIGQVDVSNLKEAMRVTLFLTDIEKKNELFNKIAMKQIIKMEIRAGKRTISFISDKQLKTLLYCSIPIMLTINYISSFFKGIANLFNNN